MRLTEALEILDALQMGSSVPPETEAVQAIAVTVKHLKDQNALAGEDFDAIIDLLARLGDRLLRLELMPQIEVYFIERFTSILGVIAHGLEEFPTPIYYIWGTISAGFIDPMPHHATLLRTIDSAEEARGMDPVAEAKAALNDLIEQGHFQDVR